MNLRKVLFYFLAASAISAGAFFLGQQHTHAAVSQTDNKGVIAKIEERMTKNDQRKGSMAILCIPAKGTITYPSEVTMARHGLHPKLTIPPARVIQQFLKSNQMVKTPSPPI